MPLGPRFKRYATRENAQLAGSALKTAATVAMLAFILKNAGRGRLVSRRRGRDWMRAKANKQFAAGQYDRTLTSDIVKARKKGVHVYSYSGSPINAFAAPFSDATAKQNKKQQYSPNEKKLVSISKGNALGVIEALTKVSNPTVGAHTLLLAGMMGPKNLSRILFSQKARQSILHHEVGHTLDAKQIDREQAALGKKYPTMWSQLRHPINYSNEAKRATFNREVRAYQKGAAFFKQAPDPSTMQGALRSYAGFSPAYRQRVDQEVERLHRKYTMSPAARNQRKMAARSKGRRR